MPAAKTPALPTALVRYDLIPGRRWSIVHAATGMEIAAVSGKRRYRALVQHLTTLVCSTWQEWGKAAHAWQLANPRAA